MKIGALAFLIVAGYVSPASAGSISFSFANFDGNTDGTVSGTIFGLADNTANEAATGLTITSAPAAFGLSLPVDVFNTWTIGTNNFTVSNGIVTNAAFGASAGHPDSLPILGLTISYNASGSPNLLSENDGQVTRNTQTAAANIEFGSLSGGSSTPEPSTLALAGLALVGLTFARSRASRS